MDITYFTVQSCKQFLYHKTIFLTQQTDCSYKYVGPNLEYHEALKAITMFYIRIVSVVAVFKWIYGLSRNYASNMHGRAFVYLCSSLITFSALCLFLIHRLASTVLLAPPAPLTVKVSQHFDYNIPFTWKPKRKHYVSKSMKLKAFRSASLCVLVNK
jgi:hypothetical protein